MLEAANQNKIIIEQEIYNGRKKIMKVIDWYIKKLQGENPIRPKIKYYKREYTLIVHVREELADVEEQFIKLGTELENNPESIQDKDAKINKAIENKKILDTEIDEGMNEIMVKIDEYIEKLQEKLNKTNEIIKIINNNKTNKSLFNMAREKIGKENYDEIDNTFTLKEGYYDDYRYGVLKGKGGRRNKSRRNKTRRNKSRRNKSRRNKSRRRHK
jgi:hypothetical protein